MTIGSHLRLLQMMISKFQVIGAVALAAVVACSACGAEGSPSAAAAYYQRELKNKPQGVYEWPEKGLLFVQVHVPYITDGSENLDARTLLAEHQELYAWLIGKASERKVDPQLPPGLDRVRRLVRANYPTWEYTVSWEYKLDGQAFSREETGKRVACVVCDRKSVEATMPKAFLAPVPEATWLAGARELVDECYAGRVNVPFMEQVGLFDCAEVRGKGKVPTSGPVTQSPAYREYLEVERATADYLAASPLAKSLRVAQKGLEDISNRLDVAYVVPPESFVTNVSVNVSTNCAVAANAVTNRTVVPFVGITAVMPAGGTVIQRSVRNDESIITTVETCMVVRTRRVLVQRIARDYHASARFERLFLSGGKLENVASARTERSKVAERAFFDACAQEERERLVLEALRENPGDKMLWNFYGRLLMNGKDWLGARICFRNALRLDHEYQFALTNLALTYQAMGRRELAVSTALVAYGLATDGWCKSQAEGVLKAK